MTLSTTDLAVLFVVLVFASLVAPLAYVAWVRKTERYNTEAWGPLLRAFAYGAFIGTIVSAILEEISIALYASVVQPDLGLPNNGGLEGLVLACVFAPFIEEGMKGLGAYRVRDQMRYVADGLVFGSAVGFGFSFLENLLYGGSALITGGTGNLEGDLAIALTVIVVRSFSSSLLHGSATAMTGFGVAEDKLHQGQGHYMASYYLLAVAMHASFNALASLTTILPLLGFTNLSTGVVDEIAVLGLLAAITYAFGVFSYVRRKITEMQFRSLSPMTVPAARIQYSHSRYGGGAS